MSTLTIGSKGSLVRSLQLWLCNFEVVLVDGEYGPTTARVVKKAQAAALERGLSIGAKQPDGKVEPWAIEGGTPNVLFRRGFTKQSLTAGTEIAIDGYRAKDGTRRANGRDLTFPDGRKLFLGSSGTGAPYELRPGQK